LLVILFALNILLNKFTSITPFKLKYAYKLKFALKAIIKAIDLKLLIKRGAKAFVKEY
jgi:hypothetical protein